MSNPILKELAAFTLDHELEIACGQFKLRESFRYCHKRYPAGEPVQERVETKAPDNG